MSLAIYRWVIKVYKKRKDYLPGVSSFNCVLSYYCNLYHLFGHEEYKVGYCVFKFISKLRSNYCCKFKCYSFLYGFYT